MIKRILLTWKYWIMYVVKWITLQWKKIRGDDIDVVYVLEPAYLDNNTYRKWMGWKSRENYSFEGGNVPSADLRTIESIKNNEHKEVMTTIKYRSEEKDYWKSAEEVMMDGFGDCEDQASLLYRKIIERYNIFNDCYICLIPYHAFVIVRAEGSYWMFDNGAYTMKAEKLKDVMKAVGIEPMYAFTYDTFYRFKAVG